MCSDHPVRQVEIGDLSGTCMHLEAGQRCFPNAKANQPPPSRLTPTFFLWQVCAYRCITSYETKTMENFSLCVLQKNNCMGNSAQIPVLPDPTPLARFRGEAVTQESAQDMFMGWLGKEAFSWKVVSMPECFDSSGVSRGKARLGIVCPGTSDGHPFVLALALATFCLVFSKLNPSTTGCVHFWVQLGGRVD